MPIERICEPSEEVKKELGRLLNARYKSYKEARDKDEAPTAANEFEALTFAMAYELGELNKRLNKEIIMPKVITQADLDRLLEDHASYSTLREVDWSEYQTDQMGDEALVHLKYAEGYNRGLSDGVDSAGK